MSTTSATSGGSQAQRVLATLLQQTSATDGPEKPTGPKGAGGPPSGPPPGPPPGGGAQQFAANTLGSLLGVQESSDAGDLAAQLIENADSDTDGALGVEEIQTALGAEASEELSAAVSNLDTDDDGKLSSEELSAGLEANRPERRGPPPSAAVASRLIDEVDADSDGALSLAEIQSQLELDAGSDLAGAFGGLDADGDGLLGAAELTAALDAFQAARGEGRQPQATVTA